MDTDLSAMIIFYAIKGLEVPYIRQNISDEFEKNKKSIVEFVLQGIKRARIWEQRRFFLLSIWHQQTNNIFIYISDIWNH